MILTERRRHRQEDQLGDFSGHPGRTADAHRLPVRRSRFREALAAFVQGLCRKRWSTTRRDARRRRWSKAGWTLFRAAPTRICFSSTCGPKGLTGDIAEKSAGTRRDLTCNKNGGSFRSGKADRDVRHPAGHAGRRRHAVSAQSEFRPNRRDDRRECSMVWPPIAEDNGGRRNLGPATGRRRCASDFPFMRTISKDQETRRTGWADALSLLRP